MTVLMRDAAAGVWRRFDQPLREIVARDRTAVLDAIREAERAAADGHWVAGWVSYDAAPAFDAALVARGVDAPEDTAEPLVWFGVFAATTAVDAPAADPTPALPWQPAITRDDYGAAIWRIRDHIADGDTYQTNFTFPLVAPAPADAAAFFRGLARAQPAPYAAFIDTDRWAIASVSPELFFTLNHGVLTSRPMKGTIARGRFPAEDRARAEWLRASEKNRAENVMIVDMIRNDIGRVADVGTVVVESLFDVEPYPTVWQMTSTVTGRTHAPIVEIFRALFPCASITGAPKARTTRVIAELETQPRGLYTGAVGFIAPDSRAQFSVAIRTVVIDRAAGTARYGIGSGVTWDSDATDEYDECLAKARVLGDVTPTFDLLETMRWTPADGVTLYDRHIARLRASAQYFGRPFNEATARDAVDRALTPAPTTPQRLRLLVGADGSARCESAPLTPLPEPLRLALASSPVSSGDVWLFHKTTHRAVYDAARRDQGHGDDVLLWNERGEITETTIANIVVEFDGRRYTPPVTCGLLNGTLREELLARGEITERVITRDDLARATRITLINSVRGELDAVYRVGAPS